MKKGTCKHYRGTREPCDAGIDIRALVGGPDLGWATRMPCHKEGSLRARANGPIPYCAKYEEPSAEDLVQYESDTQAAIARFEKVLPLVYKIKEENEGKSAEGVVPCPVCGEKLHWAHASVNGHVWGRCETEDCVRWME